MSEYSKHDGLATLIIEEEGSPKQGYASGPERGLLSALLFDGVQSYLSFCLTDHTDMKTKYHESYHWVHDNDTEYVFSFENVCEALGVEPNGLRLGLANFINSNQIETESKNFRRARRHS